MKEQIIQLPDNLEVKEIKDGKIILVEKEKKLTYEDVAKKLFPYETSQYYILSNGDINKIKNSPSNYKLPNNALSKKQLEKLLAINKLMNVAKYLNGDWKPNWNEKTELKWVIYNDYNVKIDGLIHIDSYLTFHNSPVVFKSKELAQQAVEILGEETIKLALCTDY